MLGPKKKCSLNRGGLLNRGKVIGTGAGFTVPIIMCVHVRM